jgi:hypothetical protein
MKKPATILRLVPKSCKAGGNTPPVTPSPAPPPAAAARSVFAWPEGTAAKSRGSWLTDEDERRLAALGCWGPRDSFGSSRVDGGAR